jgi:hypothetical protein
LHFAHQGLAARHLLDVKTSTMLLAILAMVIATRLEAWPTRLYTDAEVVKRSDLIVLAHVEVGSIKKVLHEGGASYEHRAVLVVSRVIKGEFHNRKLPFKIPYGLIPVSAQYEKNIDQGDATRRSPPEEPGETVRIYEDNPSEGFFRPSGDVHQEQIWLLRHNLPPNANAYSGGAADDILYISAPEDIQPLSKEQQLRKYLVSH